MAFVAFLGCDGSGKSAVIAGVGQRLRDSGVEVWTGHWRPQALDPARSDESKLATADDPHGQQPRGILSSILKLGWLWANWWLGWWRDLRARRAKGVVLYDRYHADLWVDPRRYRYGGPVWMARWASRLMPQPDRVFFLDADPDVLLSRKQEVGREALESARAAYLRMTSLNARCRVIDASLPLEAVISEIGRELEHVMASP